MEISRDNYEEYFLMYADNELTDAEKAEVLIFLKSNRDLEEEFRMILGTVSAPVDIRLEHKEFLYKARTVNTIGQDNFEEFFVQYHDGELPCAEQEDVLSFLKENPYLKPVFEQIGLARLRADESVVFEEKQALYKNRSKIRKIRPLWWSLASAAAVAGLGWWMLARYTEVPTIAPTSKIQVAGTTRSADSASHQEGSQLTTPGKESSPHAVEPRDRAASPEVADLKTRSLHTASPTGDDKGLSVRGSHAAAPPLKELTGVPASAVALQTARLSRNAATGVLPQQPGSLQALTLAQVNHPESTTAAQPNRSDSSATEAPGAVRNGATPNQDYVFYDVTASEYNRTRMGGFIKKVRRIIHRSNPINRLFEGNEQP